jgi:hypothetical protein
MQPDHVIGLRDHGYVGAFEWQARHPYTIL